jgi:dTDP-4-amino-4,6-dideoxygalactose transaminase
MIGFNFRLGEIEAAIGREQLKKGGGLIAQRKENVAYLESRLKGLPGLSMPHIGAAADHVYYVHVLDYDAGVTGVSRERMVQALKAELPVTELREGDGPLMGMGYVKPLYLMPMFQNQIAYGKLGYPFTSSLYQGKVDYRKGLCPNVERAHFERVITHEMMRPGMSKSDLDDVAAAFHKVWGALPALREMDNAA